jgi:hypothetical protein
MKNEILTPEKVESLHQIFKSGKIYWIKSWPTLRKWVENDMKGNNILDPIVIGEGKGRRYFVKKENIDKYVQAFENHQLN